MKYAICLFIIAAFALHVHVSAQVHQDYSRQWERIKEAEKKGLSQTAWDLAKDIYKKAHKKGDEQQQLKALIYQLKYRDHIEENADVKNIHEVDSLAHEASGISKALLQNLAANLYLGYVHRNRYTLLNRIASTAEQEEALTTWSLPHFYNRISSLFQQSLKNKDTLKTIPVQDYTVLIDTGKNALALRPTLYDVLVHNALQYFTSNESTLTKPAQHFVINNPAAFAPAAAFCKQPFHTTDSASLSWQALQLYQDLIRFHLKDKKADALIDADIDRLQFVYRNAVMPEKDSLYKNALRHIINRYAIPGKSKAFYLLARWFYQKGRTYDAQTRPEYRWALKKALSICEKASDTLINEGNVNCKKLKDAILHPELSLNIEQVNIPGKPFRVLVAYRNNKKFRFRLIQLDSDPEEVFNQKTDLYQLLQKEVVAHWTQEFPLPDDYQQHAAEMKVNALQPGRYALLASADADFNTGKSPVVYATFFVSNLSYVTDNEGGFLVLNRETGKPEKKAKVRIWTRHYNASKRKYELKDEGKYKTDQKGYFHLTATDINNRYIMPEISTKDDHLFIGQARYIPYVHSSSSVEKKNLKGYLFTDRSIYRPGQKLYFKGLIIQSAPSSNEREIIKDHAVSVFLFDANNQKVDSLNLKSNAFGSFAGSFELPSALMNGRMHLSVDSLHAYQYFSVEDYKRPTYDLTWDSVSHTYQLGDTVSVSGEIMGYNGAPEGGAAIKYQVSRKRYAIPFYRSHRQNLILYPTTTATIAQGEIEAGTSGQFHIRFAAIPDEEVPAGNRIFSYEVSVDVTNPTGESHHYSYQLPIGDKSLLLQLEMADKLNSQNLDTLYLKSTDLDGQFTAVPVAVSMYALKAPGRFIRERYWPEPDQFIMDKKEYLGYFPHDAYKGEADPKNWETGHPVYVSTDTTKADGKIHFYYGKLLPGWYLIKVMAKDLHGHFVTDSQYVQIYDAGDNHVSFHQVLWTNTNELKGQPGKEVSWDIGSSEKAFVYEQTETLNDTSEVQELRLNDKIKKESQTINDSDLGGIIKHYIAVQFNRVFTEDVKIEVPWKKKQLHISYETFRNKLLPGEKETWEIKITGPQQQKTDAELLASMYDVSLDNFVPHEWGSIDEVHPVLYGKIRWEGNESFSSEYSREVYKPEPLSYPDYTRVYPSLKDFGYNWNNRLFHYAGPIRLNGVTTQKDQVILRGKPAVSNSTARNAAAPQPEAENATREKQPKTPPTLNARKDFRETAFFYPQLHTDDSGRISFTFTAPEALTRWKLMLLAHSKDLKFAYSERETVTQKPLMIQMNAPRFVRQGDNLMLSARISNLSNDNQSGNAVLSFKNTITGQTISLVKNSREQTFSVAPGQSTTVTWRVPVPDHFNDALTYVVHAHSDNFNDGEQDVIPVLTNKAAITESLPLHFSGNGTHTLHWDALEKSENQQADIQPEGITIEYTGNPVWYAVQALPFLDNETRKSANALYRKVYAHALSNYMVLHIPHFKDIMEDWLTGDSAALKSPLQKNEELKNVLLEETPWVENAQKEAAQKAKVAHWYTEQDRQLRLQASVTALEQMQLSNGGFSWFKDMPDNRLVTQQIISGLGHLKALHAWPHLGHHELRQIILKAIPYLDARMKENYNRLQDNKNTEDALTPINIQYLYMRSFFPDIALNDSVKTAYRYFLKKAAKDWTRQNTYLKAMLALAFHRLDSGKMAQSILRSLSETAIHDKNGGMYWKQPDVVHHWYQAPITTQAICIEAFRELQAEPKTINALRSWLLSQKQTQYWGSGHTTANAIYALLFSSTEWTRSNVNVRLKLGGKTYHFGEENSKGLQYQKVFIPAEAIHSEMKNIQVTVSGAAEDQPSWGALYFQYFKNMNRVDKGKGSELYIERQISLETNTVNGPRLSPVTKTNSLQVGDKVEVRLIIRADRDMDFVHLKDVRASCMEPLQVLSGYHWKNGVGYYSTVTDAAVHFYFQHLPKGTYVFTYPVYITQKGNFTGGMSQIECLYAPEIRSHSEGIGLHVQ